jgi:hypothetical protein
VTRLSTAAPPRALLRTVVGAALVASLLAWVAARPRPGLVPVRSTAVELDEPWEGAGLAP